MGELGGKQRFSKAWKCCKLETSLLRSRIYLKKFLAKDGKNYKSAKTNDVK